MSRRIELIAALLACALGLIWLLSEVTSLQSLWATGALAGSGASRPPAEPIEANGTGFYFLGIAVAAICVALGAYLHVVQRLLPGLLLLWVAAAVATVAIVVYLIEPWQLVPLQFVFIARELTAPWLTPIGVLSLVFAWIAAVAGLPVRHVVATPVRTTDRASSQPGSEPLAAP